MTTYWAPTRIGEAKAEAGYIVEYEEDDDGRQVPCTYLQRVLIGVEPHQSEIDPDNLAESVRERLQAVCRQHCDERLACEADEAAIDAYLRREAA